MLVESPIGAEIVLCGKRYINFAGSSYLGLSGVSEVIEAGVATLRESGAGYQIGRFSGIVSRAHEEVETAAADFFSSEAALYLASGYHTSLAVIAALKLNYQLIFFDALSHYSLREAIAASGLPNYQFAHADPESLLHELKNRVRAGERPLVVTDGLFGAFGELAPLGDLAPVVERFGGHILVDESHSFGTLGLNGRGVCEHYGLAGSLVTVAGSLGKAFGSTGGIIPTSVECTDALRATPVVIGSSPGSPVSASMCARAISYARTHPELLRRLRENTSFLKSGLRELGLEVGPDDVPIATFAHGGRETMRRLQERLMGEGVFVLYTNYRGTDEGGAIRCGIFADHTGEHLRALLDALHRLL